MQHSNKHTDDSTAATVIAPVTDILSAKLRGKISPEQRRLCIAVYSTYNLPHLYNDIEIRKLQQRELIMQPSWSVQVHDSPIKPKNKNKNVYFLGVKTDFHKPPFIKQPPLQ